MDISIAAIYITRIKLLETASHLNHSSQEEFLYYIIVHNYQRLQTYLNQTPDQEKHKLMRVTLLSCKHRSLQHND
jgi:hypothetical protein